MQNKNTNTTHSSKPFVIVLSALMWIYILAFWYLLISNFSSQKTLEKNQADEKIAKENLEKRIQEDSYKNFLMAKKIYELRTIPWYDSITQLVYIKDQLKSRLWSEVSKDFVIDFNQAKMNWTVRSIDTLYNKKDWVLQIFDDVLTKVYQQNNLIKPTDSIVNQITHEDWNNYDFALNIKLSNGTKK